MYYSYPCPVCGSVFSTYSEDSNAASQSLYNGIQEHMQNYGELQKGSDTLDHNSSQDANTIYSGMTSSSEKPSGGYYLD
jgi:hypothetical protein